MRKITVLILSILFVISSGRVSAYNLKDDVHEFQLSNGMRWLILRHGGAPVFTGVIMVRAGGADEVGRKTGIAHMFEHMAFKGSSRLGTKDFSKEKPILNEIEKLGQLREKQKESGAKRIVLSDITKQMAVLEKKAQKYRIKNEIWQVMMRNGVRNLNAFTMKDITTFHASMPSNRLELWARIFADMMFDPTYREFYTERDVVANERRMRTENNADGKMAEILLPTAFKDGPYHWSTIGFMKDIKSLTIADAKSFHDEYYVPSNMVGVIVGNIRIGVAKRIIRRIFGKYPKRFTPPSPKSGGTPVGGVTESFEFRASPSIILAYHKPTLPDKHEYVFDVISSILCDGASSRLKKDLIYKRHMLEGLYCTDSFPGSRYDNLFLIWANPIKGYSLKLVQKAIKDEVGLLQRVSVKEGELERVRKQVKSSFLFTLEDETSLAVALAKFQSIFGDWRILADYPSMVEKVSAKDIMDTAKKFLTKKNMVIIKRRETR